MNRKFLKLISLTLALATAFPVFAGCKDKGNDSSSSGSGTTEQTGKKLNNEEDVLVFSSGDFDGVFNPFFSTSAYDSSIVGQTQISMISSDDTGNNVTFGKDEPVVTFDYSEIMYDAAGNVTTLGDENGTTVYQMVLKDDILFSDGQPLTAHDVLFNMYVYLDPNYTGSSTMYSTDIVGLRNYQMQTEGEVSEGAAAAMDRTFATLAGLRTKAIVEYVMDKNWNSAVATYNKQCADQQIAKTYDEESINKDIARIKELWIEEITTDWNAASSDLASMQTEYPFTKTWQLYFYNEGLISRKSTTTAGVTTYPKDTNGKYIIEWENYGIDPNAEYTKEQAIEEVKTAYLGNDEFIAQILGGWATAGTIATEFAAQDKELYYDARKSADGQLKVKNIEGIKIKSAAEFKGEKKYAAEEYTDLKMLEITINGVDPKAKWNFAFAVAPMHYYSTTELANKALADEDFDSDFGVEFSSVDFMNALKRRNSVPMGAGIYKASTKFDYAYDWSNDQESYTKLANEFWLENICYFIRNDNFVTTGGNPDAVYNAKIKHIQYKVVNSANTMTALQSGTIHYADPSATTDNINIIEGHTDLDRIMLKTAGYGYIGINAKFVPNLYVRRAIMSAMDISLVQNYYPGTLSEPIYRAFSKVSWVYNEFADDGIEAWDPVSLDGKTDEQYYPYYGDANNYAKVKETVIAYLYEGGCYTEGGKWFDENGELLKYTFTVAGDTTDHPAYKTFLKARDILNSIGMEIEVIPDSRALFKLASGSIAIWAAAWSASLDPDMYQVYHRDSKATSILNWGYDWIKTDGSAYEKELVNNISELIEQGRETIVPAERARTYREASDLVMELAVELPVYQRSDMCVYNNKVLDPATFKKNPTPFSGPLSEMWKVSFI